MRKEEELFTGERFVPGIDDDEITIEHYQRYESIKELVKGKVVVDAACGEGYGTSIIGSVAKQVTGFDISEEAVKRATESYATDNVTYRIGDISNLPLEDDTVEVFVSFETIEHVDADLQVKFISEVSRVLKKDGVFIISSPNKAIYSDFFNYDNEFHVHEMYKDEFLGLLSEKFAHVKLFNQYLEVASFIDSNDNTDNKALYKKNKDSYVSDGKYFIAVASNEAVENIEIQSVYLKHDVTYRNNMARIFELQDDVENKNSHIKNLDKHIGELGDAIKHYSSREKDLENELASVKQDFMNAQEEIERKDASLSKAQDRIEMCESEIKMVKKDSVAKQEYIDLLERISEERRIELDRIRYYKKHPIRRLYRIMRRIGGKVWRKVKPAVRKIITPAVYTKKIEIPKFDSPKVSIVIPVYNEFEYTYGCIKSIIENVKNVSYEIIVGDDMSTDATKKIKKIVKNVKVNINTTDHGFLMNCNRAAKLAEGQYIIFLNNDTLVKEDWLESLVELIESDDTIGMVGSKLVYQEGILQEAGGIVFSDGSGWNYGRNQNPDMAEYNYVKDVDYISGASIMVRKSLWNQLGGFDEQFIPAYYEDTDLAFSIRKLGYRVVYQPKSVVIHFEGVSNGTDENGSGLKAYQKINKEKFLEKWKDELKLQSPSPEELFVARERGQNKKTVLFIDHYVPHFDQDAGSRSTFSYIKVFQHMGYNVKFIGDNFYPHEPYTSALQQMGIEVLYGDWYYLNWQTWIEEHAKDIDVVFANRPHITMKYIDLLKEKTNAKIIYYGHDLHHIREMREYEITKNEELLDSAKYWKKIEYDIMEKADVIFYPSYVEINEIVKNRPEFKDKARAIPVYMYEEPHKADVKLSTKEKKDLMFVGGFAHKPNADAVCWFVENVFPQVLEKYPDIKLNVIGSKPTQEVLDLASENIIVHGFVSDEELENFYHNTRMSVVPLRYGAGMKGKVVEAMYYQIPLITTSIGAEGMPEAERVMVICDEADEMAKNIIDLYENYDVLDEMSKKTVDYIQQYFSENAAEKIVRSISTN